MKSNYYRFSAMLFILTIAFSASAFAWPFGGKKKAETKSNVSSSSSQKTQSSSTASSTSQDNASGDGESASAIPTLPVVPKVPKMNVQALPELPQTKYAVKTTSAPGSLKGSATGELDPDVVRIQKQIKEIMKINESLKTDFSGQAAEIQKISDQAKIHGKILNDLDSTKKVAEDANSDKYLNREKLRLIQEETEKNKKYLQDLNSQKESAVANSSKPSALLPREGNKKV